MCECSLSVVDDSTGVRPPDSRHRRSGRRSAAMGADSRNALAFVSQLTSAPRRQLRRPTCAAPIRLTLSGSTARIARSASADYGLFSLRSNRVITCSTRADLVSPPARPRIRHRRASAVRPASCCCCPPVCSTMISTPDIGPRSRDRQPAFGARSVRTGARVPSLLSSTFIIIYSDHHHHHYYYHRQQQQM